MQHSIYNEAMLVNLHIRHWGANRKDRDAEAAVQAATDAQADAGRYTKFLVSKTAISPVRKAASAARTKNYELTLPWHFGGSARLLTVAMYEEYERTMDKYRDAFLAERRDFLANYERHVEEAKRRLGRMFRAEEYPRLYWLEQAFSFEWVISPLPKSDNLTVAISEERLAEIQQDIERRSAKAIESATMDLYARLLDAVNHVVDRMRVDGDGNAVTFRNSLFENLRAICDVVPKLNVAGDTRLDDMAQDVRKRLLSAHPDELRDINRRFDPSKRKAVASAAKELQERFAGYMKVPDAA